MTSGRIALRNTLLTTMAATAVLVVVPGQAQAAGGTCTATRGEQAISFQPNKYNVNARCGSLNANSKARGVLDIPADIDVSTSWFTRLNTTYSSSYRQSLAGTPVPRTEITNV